MPAYLFAEIALHFIVNPPPARTQRCRWQPECGCKDHFEYQERPNHPTYGRGPVLWHRCQPALAPSCTGSVEHWVCRTHVVPAALCQDKQQQRDDVHPADQPKTLSGCCEEAKVQASQSQQEAKPGQFQLLRKKVSCA